MVHGDPDDPAGLCTDLHAVNTALEEQGFGPGLLCSLVPFASTDGRRVGLVYLYKQGTLLPVRPAGPAADRERDNLLEIQLRDTLAGELPWSRTSAAGWPSGAPRVSDPQVSTGTPDRRSPLTGRTDPADQSLWVLPGRASIRSSATRAYFSVSGSTSIRFTTWPATSDSSAHTKCGRSIRFIVEQ